MTYRRVSYRQRNGINPKNRFGKMKKTHRKNERFENEKRIAHIDADRHAEVSAYDKLISKQVTGG